MKAREKFDVTRKELCRSLLEREAEVDMVLTAMVAGEHCLFIGPPGTAKSMLAESVVQWLHGDRFSVLVNKFTTPEEIFGPISVQGLKEDRYRRIISGKLPTADVAFIDEIFKSSSAILNTLLGILNERVYRNDGVLVQCPLSLCIGASNEWPGEESKELSALFDRFVLRKSVRPIGLERSMDRLLFDKNLSVKLSTQLSKEELGTAIKEAKDMDWAEDAKDAFRSIYRESRNEGIFPGDRRLRKSVGVAQAFAWLDGAEEVSPEHLEILQHVLWDEPHEHPKKIAEIVGKVANPSGMKINTYLLEMQQIMSKVNFGDTAAAATAAKKLAVIRKELEKISGHKAQSALEKVRGEIDRLKREVTASF